MSKTTSVVMSEPELRVSELLIEKLAASKQQAVAW
jgi:hypothetical protein